MAPRGCPEPEPGGGAGASGRDRDTEIGTRVQGEGERDTGTRGQGHGARGGRLTGAAAAPLCVAPAPRGGGRARGEQGSGGPQR